MPLPDRADGENMPSIPMDRPAESAYTIGGRLYVFRTWTAAQWDAIPPERRPRTYKPHGNGWSAVEPS